MTDRLSAVPINNLRVLPLICAFPSPLCGVCMDAVGVRSSAGGVVRVHQVLEAKGHHHHHGTSPSHSHPPYPNTSHIHTPIPHHQQSATHALSPLLPSLTPSPLPQDESVPYNMISAINHPKRIFPVGRLDKDSSGLILLTNDGRVPNAVLRTERGHGKEYVVGVHTPISDDCLERLAKGVVISTPVQRDRTSKLITARTLPCDVTRIDPRSFRIVLREGRNRQIRRMCQALGYDVTRLHRRRVMDIDLKDLDGPGEWVELDRLERMSVQRAIDKAEQQAKERGEEGQGEEEGGEDDEE